MEGSLEDMGVAELIQHLCIEGKSGHITVKHDERQAEIYIKAGKVIHALYEDLKGEEVIYEVLGWKEGTFRLSKCNEFPTQTISMNWPALLMEGTRRLDERSLGHQTQEKDMAQLDEILKQMAGEINGFMAAVVTGMDGLNIAQYARAKVNVEAIGAQLTLFLKLVDTSVESVQAGALLDDILTTENALVVIRFLPDRKGYLGVIVDRKNGNIGNVRMVTGVFLDRLSKAISAM